MTPIYVVIPVKDNLPYTQGLVGQLVEQGEATRILVFDNGSTDGTREWLDAESAEHPELDWVTASGDTIHQMWNAGLDACAYDAKGQPHSVAILNNDIRIGDHFLSALERVLRMDPMVGVVGANYDGRRFECGAMPVTTICANRYDGTGGLPGFAFMLRGEGRYRFPEELRWWCGDNDLLATMIRSGRLALLARDAVCEHLDGGGRTGRWNDPEWRPVLAQDLARFRAKWG